MTVTYNDDTASYEQDVLNWRAGKDAELRRDEGWLTLAGLFWLEEGVNTIGSASDNDVNLPNGTPEKLGTLTLRGSEITLEVTSDASVQVDNAPVRSTVLRYGAQPSRVTVNQATFIIIKRGTQYAVRVWDRANPAREAFTGRRWFDIKPEFRVVGRFVPHTPARELQVVNILGIAESTKNPGAVEFELLGTQQRLEAFDAGSGKVWFVFKDATSGKTTYGLARFLYADIEDDGKVILDFNKAYHPPCAFTPYATCPIPLKENVLPLECEAGERL